MPNPTRTTVIWMHGMGEFQSGFADELKKTLCGASPTAPAVRDIRHEEILYDDINQQVAKKISNCDAGLSTLCGAIHFPIVGSLEKYRDPVKAAFGDVFPDWISKGVRTWIFERIAMRVLEILKAANNDGIPRDQHHIHWICHSLGTFISYEFLHWAKDMPGFGVRDFQCDNVFFLASPISLMKDLQLGAALNSYDLAINNPLSKPWVTNYATGVPMTNARKLWAFRHRYDPVASLVPVPDDILDHPAWIFDAWHEGVNMHAYTNYLTEFRGVIMERILSTVNA